MDGIRTTGTVDIETDINSRVRDENSWHRNQVFLVRRKGLNGTICETIELGTCAEVAAEPYVSIHTLEFDVLLHTTRGVFRIHSAGRR